MQFLLHCRREDGALAVRPDSEYVNPYFGNYAGLALLLDPANTSVVRGYLDWYINHIERNGTIADYDYGRSPRGVKRSPDSEDAYAGTFLSLVARYYSVSGDQQWVERNYCFLQKIAGVITRLLARDGLTVARRLFPVKYLADNCECYRGLADFYPVVGRLDKREAHIVRSRAWRLRWSIEQHLWHKDARLYCVAKYPTGWRKIPDLKRWYPDAVAAIYPAFCGVISPGSKRARRMYDLFNQFQPGWNRFKTGDPYPWMMAGYYACIHGDYKRAAEQVKNAGELFVKTNSPYWYNLEAAFYLLIVSRLMANSPYNTDAPEFWSNASFKRSDIEPGGPARKWRRLPGN